MTTKKIIILVGVAGVGVYFLVKEVAEQYQRMENSVYTTKQSRVAERHGIVSPTEVAADNRPDVKAPAPPPATPGGAAPAPGAASPVPSTAPSSTGPGVVSANRSDQPDLVLCTREIAAFDPVHPSNQIGKFLKDTPLTIGPKDTLSGMYLVTFKGPDGKAMRVLCRAEDLGK